MKHLSIILILTIISLFAASCTDGERMRQQLTELQKRNQADSLLTNDSLALALCDYFDSHGTANERLLAHYLLARTYTDMGEAPRALDEYHYAAECADTTAQDCDFLQLAKVHGQMAELFFNLYLPYEMLNELQLGYRYAIKANDTITGLIAYERQAVAYDLMGEKDSAKTIMLNTFHLFTQYGHDDMAADCVTLIINNDIEHGNWKAAKYFIDLFESRSNYFHDGEILNGHEAYYYLKSKYYIGIGENDSAEIILRKGMESALDNDVKEAICNGFSLLYKKKNMPDSVAKYAMLCYQYGSDNYRDNIANELRHIQGLYNYNRNQTIAKEKSEEARKSKQIAWIFFFLIIFLIVSCIYLFIIIRQKRKLAWERYIQDQEELEKLQESVQKLEDEKRKLEDGLERNDELFHMIEEERVEITLLNSRIQKYEQRNAKKNKVKIEQYLQTLPVYQKLHSLAEKPVSLPTDKDWIDLKNSFYDAIPHFFVFINDSSSILSDVEYRICMLTWLKFSPSEIANLLNISIINVSVIRKRLLKKLFGKEGSAKVFDVKIREIY